MKLDHSADSTIHVIVKKINKKIPFGELNQNVPSQEP